MSTGKYSPTVSYSYMRDGDWWKKNGGGHGNGKNPDSDDDDDGYDSYGYSGGGLGSDRAGCDEMEYLVNDGLYKEIYGEWFNRLAKGVRWD